MSPCYGVVEIYDPFLKKSVNFSKRANILINYISK